ncbi:helix-turn-helix domain-containing protein [Heyndrickxia ginsengihumi]|uniref:Cupin domain-containing protein n=1 Tax=Heyndrickxia ginsengihumi TaxID=363870 RepID=A0A0A6XWC6_9BACI|nr:cupin domain-containing protein [Heyndrickxia ginsengihumi]KHD84437.1 DNA-binding protein [Heyndrickxia ginsengihumi]MBE6184045.1 cupin domain-containing protein [Bacillus sp. (in: firmicutes)]MCM3024565.1 cupin domain-containing protein [Heyndrickxia ginsengihumi]NEY18774.1 cupin domain-containing protein [Heyndrickxia ginsengihumi]
MDHIQEIIASNLISLRKNRGLSLDKMSEITGVSKAMLAQIEKGKSSPTVSTLWKIANGLQVSFSVLMKEDKPQVTKINIEQLTPAIDDEGNYLVYSFFPYHPEKRFEIYIVNLKPGFTHQAEAHLGEEYILIKEGELTIDIEGDVHILRPGDAIQFTSNTKHSYTNATEKLVSFFMLIYYPESY